MIELIKEILKREGIENWLMTTREESRYELYYVKKEIDQKRFVETTVTELTVYKDADKNGKAMRGFSSVILSPEMDEERLSKEIREAFYAAGFALNPAFLLEKGSFVPCIRNETGLSALSLPEMAGAFADAVFTADHEGKSFLNSLEVFANRRHVFIRNSEGLDVSYVQDSVKGEFVVQCREPLDVELYRDFAYEDLDTKALTLFTEEALNTVADRAIAKAAPKSGSYDLILSGAEVGKLLSFFTERSSASMIYPGYSSLKTSKRVQPENLKGEALNITLHAGYPYSAEGIPMKDTQIIREGEVTAIHGGGRLCQYLGVPATGIFNSMIVDNGSLSEAQLKEKPYLHVVNFSDFDVDSYTGSFCGEIRLAYLFDGKTVTPVTGGSVSGSVMKKAGQLLFSKERIKTASYEGPSMVRIPAVSVAGN